MKNFYFIRHAQSEANKAEIMCGGGVDTPLSDEGVAQAEAARDVLQQADLPLKPTHLIHSGMLRTEKTATLINGALSLPMLKEHALREHEVGLWEGMKWDDIAHDFTHAVDPPNGETHAAFAARVKQGFETSLQLYDVPFFSAHGGVWIALMKLYNPDALFLMENAIPHYCVYDDSKKTFPWHVYRITAHGLDLIKEI